MSDLLIKWIAINRKNNESALLSQKRVIDAYQSICSLMTTEFITRNYTLLEEFIQVKELYRQRSKQTSFNFNFFTFFTTGEVIHSLILAKLLNPHAEHGQDSLFLNIFLKKIGIPDSNGNWTITTEKGRVDILLKRYFPPTVIVIENKSNWAPDQGNQLYRYWYSEIYYPLKYSNSAHKDSENYKLIYLAPNTFKKVNPQSLTKPDNWHDEDAPENVNIELKYLYFEDDIVEWITEAISLINSENHRLREFLQQYINLWRK